MFTLDSLNFTSFDSLAYIETMKFNHVRYVLYLGLSESEMTPMSKTWIAEYGDKCSPMTAEEVFEYQDAMERDLSNAFRGCVPANELPAERLSSEG